MIVKQLFLFCAVEIWLSGCATLYGQNNREVAITTTPEGASVYLDNVFYGKTPDSVLLPNLGYSGKVITLKKSGYKDKNILIESEFQKVGYWNIIVFPAFLFDLGTGCMFQVKQGNYVINLDLQSVAAAESGDIILLKRVNGEVDGESIPSIPVRIEEK